MRFLEVFSPALIPGRSIVAFQDYLHEPSYALPALLACCGDVFKLVDVALPGSTALFEVHGTLLLDADRRRTMDILRWSAAETVAALAAERTAGASSEGACCGQNQPRTAAV
jgi:hypothetical protein